MTEAEIEADADLRERAAKDKRFKQDLLDGHPWRIALASDARRIKGAVASARRRLPTAKL